VRRGGRAGAGLSRVLNAGLPLSTDPAHSLADVFGAALSDAPVAVRGAPPNLLARELDASARFRDVRERYAAAIDSLFDRLTRDRSGTVSVDAGQDRRVMHGLIDLAPPGIDELAAVIEVTDALEPGATDLASWTPLRAATRCAFSKCPRSAGLGEGADVHPAQTNRS
jgi:hypothetical protein